MGAGRDVQAARRLYQASGSGDVPAISDRVTGDAGWSAGAAIVPAPWSGPGTARTGSPASSRPPARPGRSPSSPRWPFAGTDEGDVMVFIRYAFTVTATGKHVAMNMHHYRSA